MKESVHTFKKTKLGFNNKKCSLHKKCQSAGAEQVKKMIFCSFWLILFATVLFAMNYWHCKIADVTCDDFSGETSHFKPPPLNSPIGGGVESFPHKILGVVSIKGVSLIFTLTKAF